MGQYDDRPYKVGKGKPPAEYRWKPGQSGNPKGPKKRADPKTATMSELLADAINGTTEVTIDGKRVMMTKKQLILLGLVHDAASGTPNQRIRAIRELRDVGAFDLLPLDKQPDPEEHARRIAAVVEELAREAEREEQLRREWGDVGGVR